MLRPFIVKVSVLCAVHFPLVLYYFNYFNNILQANIFNNEYVI